MEDFIYKYYIEPIWAGTGYNPINTITYAVIALLALYMIWLSFKKYNVKIDRKLIYGVLTFVLLGSTVRVVTDSIKNEVFKPVTPIHQAVLSSHIYDYGYLSVSPGIYIVIAAILFITMAILWKIKKPELLGTVGLVLWVPHLLLLLPFMSYLVYIFPILVLTAVPTFIAWKYFKNEIYALIVAAQSLDGAATFFIIDIFSKISGKVYFEQHVIGGAIGQIFGTFFAFFLVKMALSLVISYVLSREKDMSEDELNFIALAIMIMGFAPGIRSLVRLALGS